MSKLTFRFAAPLAIAAALPLAAPAQACKTPPAVTQCTVLQPMAAIREAPEGKVTSAATGSVRIAHFSKDGLWARIEVPCLGFLGWIARHEIACGGASVNPQASAKP
ncbi:MAG: hypothetical protein L0Y57_04980 [Beijerinckiaceae bacterium]|nr:hypothetical protein [Beijerinckiaceae bacterium]